MPVVAKKKNPWDALKPVGAAGAVKPAKGFTPTPAPVPPAGTYDPGLDAQRRAASRGLTDLQQDVEKGNERASTAYTSGVERTGVQRGWSLADLLTTKTRTQGDLATSLGRSREDHTRLSDDLRRGFAQLGDAQTNKASSGAFVDTGSIAAGAGVRADNQAREQSVMDLNQNRYEADNASAVGRSNEDFDRGVERTNKSFDWQGADLASNYQYGVDDNAMSLARALREDTFYGQDIDTAKMAQATQSGLYTPPQAPKNEFSDSKGPYQLIVSGGLRYKLRPGGKREPAGVAK